MLVEAKIGDKLYDNVLCFAASVNVHKTVRQGHTVTLPCHSAKSVEWRFNRRKIYSSGNLLDSKYKVHIADGQQNLLFTNAFSSDSGQYECFEGSGGPLKIRYSLKVLDGNCLYIVVICTC